MAFTHGIAGFRNGSPEVAYVVAADDDDALAQALAPPPAGKGFDAAPPPQVLALTVELTPDERIALIDAWCDQTATLAQGDINQKTQAVLRINAGLRKLAKEVLATKRWIEDQP